MSDVITRAQALGIPIEGDVEGMGVPAKARLVDLTEIPDEQSQTIEVFARYVTPPRRRGERVVVEGSAYSVHLLISA